MMINPVVSTIVRDSIRHSTEKSVYEPLVEYIEKNCEDKDLHLGYVHREFNMCPRLVKQLSNVK